MLSGLDWKGGLITLPGLDWKGGLTTLPGLDWKGGLTILPGLDWKGGLIVIAGLDRKGGLIIIAGLDWKGGLTTLSGFDWKGGLTRSWPDYNSRSRLVIYIMHTSSIIVSWTSSPSLEISLNVPSLCTSFLHSWLVLIQRGSCDLS